MEHHLGKPDRPPPPGAPDPRGSRSQRVMLVAGTHDVVREEAYLWGPPPQIHIPSLTLKKTLD